MRRATLVALVGVTLSLSLASESLAGVEPNASVPASVVSGSTFTLTVQNCGSASGPPAFIWVESESDAWDGSDEQDADADGMTEIPQIFDKAGMHALEVGCIYEGTNSPGNWREILTVTVTPALTADERTKCKRIDDRAKRKRCLKKQAAD